MLHKSPSTLHECFTRAYLCLPKIRYHLWWAGIPRFDWVQNHGFKPMNIALSTDSKKDQFTTYICIAIIQLHWKIIFAIYCLTRLSFLQKSIINGFNIPPGFLVSFAASLCEFYNYLPRPSTHAVTPSGPGTHLAKIYQICGDGLHQHKNRREKKTSQKGCVRWERDVHLCVTGRFTHTYWQMNVQHMCKMHLDITLLQILCQSN